MKTKTYELIPNNGQLSFYGKATVTETKKTMTLFSYGTKIAVYNKGEGSIRLTKDWDYSNTTITHLRSFLGRFVGDGSLTKKQIAIKYAKTKEEK